MISSQCIYQGVDPGPCSVEGGGGSMSGGTIKKKKARMGRQNKKGEVKGEGGRARCVTVKGSGKTQHAGGADRAEHA